jgi:hypothetical protein
MRLDTRVAPPTAYMSLPGCDQGADVLHVSDDPCRLPGDLLQGLREDDMGDSVGEAGVGDLVLRGRPAAEGQIPGRVGQDGEPVPLIVGVHHAPQDAGVDGAEHLEDVVPGLFILGHRPVELAIGALDEAIH